MTDLKRIERTRSYTRRRNSRLWRVETAEANDARTRNESMAATEAYRRLLEATGHLPKEQT